MLRRRRPSIVSAVATLATCVLMLVGAAQAQDNDTKWEKLVADTDQFARQGNFDQAKGLCTQALELSKSEFDAKDERIGRSHVLMSRLKLATGSLQESVTHADAAVAIYDKQDWSDKSVQNQLQPHVDVLVALLAELRERVKEARDFQKSESLARDALRFSENVYGPDSPRLLPHLDKLAGIQRSINRPDQSLALFERALKIRRSIPDISRDELLGNLYQASSVARESGSFEKGIKLLEEIVSLEDERESEGQRSWTQFYLGFCYANAGSTEKAEECLARALKTQESLFGKDSPELASLLFQLSSLRFGLTQHDEALKLCLRLIEIDQARDPVDELQLGSDFGLLGQVYGFQGRADDAIEAYIKAHNHYSKSNRADLRNVIAVNSNMARQLLLTGENPRAAQAFETAMGLWKRIPPEFRDTTQENLIGIQLRFRSGDRAGAEADINRFLDFVANRMGKDNLLYLTAQMERAEILLSQDKYEPALADARAALRGMREGAGDDLLGISGAMARVGYVEYYCGEKEAGYATCAEALDILNEGFSFDHPDKARCLQIMAFGAHDEGDVDGALKMLEDAKRMFKSAYGRDSFDHTRTGQIIGNILDATGERPVPGEEVGIVHTPFPNGVLIRKFRPLEGSRPQLQKGDSLLTIDGEDVCCTFHAANILKRLRAEGAKTCTMKIVRSGKESEVQFPADVQPYVQFTKYSELRAFQLQLEHLSDRGDSAGLSALCRENERYLVEYAVLMFNEHRRAREGKSEFSVEECTKYVKALANGTNHATVKKIANALTSATDDDLAVFDRFAELEMDFYQSVVRGYATKAEEALEEMREVRDDQTFGFESVQIAIYEAQLEDLRQNYESSVPLLLDAVEKSRELGNLGEMAASMLHLGGTYRRLGRHDLAEQMLIEVIDILEETVNEDKLPAAFRTLAVIRVEQGLLDDALHDAKRALQESLEWKDPGSIARSYMTLGLQYLTIGEYALAETSLEIAMQKQRRLGLIQSEYVTSRGHAMAIARGRDPEKAEELLTSLITHMEKKKAEDAVLPAFYTLDRGEIAWRLGRFQNAIEFLEQGVQIHLESRPQTRSIKSTSHTYNEYYDYHVILADSLRRIGRANQALEKIERARERTGLNAVADVTARRPAPSEPADLEAKRDALKKELDELSRRIGAADVAGKWEERMTLLREQRHKLNDLSRVLTRIRLAQYEQGIVLNEDPVDMSTFQRSVLQNGSAALYYAIGRYAGCGVLVQKNGGLARVFEIDVDGLVDAIEKHNSNVRSASSSVEDVVTSGRELYLRLVGPVAQELRTIKSLVVIPDQILESVPFETLVPESTSTYMSFSTVPFLGIERSISYLPSMSIGVDLANRPSLIDWANATVLSCGAPDFSLETPPAGMTRDQAVIAQPLPDVKSEMDAVLNAIGAENAAARLEGAEAKESSIRNDPRLDSYDVLHFATHASSDPTQPMRSGLLLTFVDDEDDGFLTAEEVLDLRLSAELVILSRRHPTPMRPLSSSHVLGLEMAIFHAGARGVLTTRWFADPAATAAMLEDALGRVRNDEISISEALRLARKEMLKKDKEAHPALWSAFAYWGPGRVN